ncbi:MAG: carboxylate-amine ligase [Hyphomicrobiaceae bacterium]
MLKPPSFTFGIEEEYHLVDLETRDLAPAPVAMMEACQARLGDRVSPEFLQSQIEIGTGVCHLFAAARGEVAELRLEVARMAREHGLAPIAAGTHPFGRWTELEHTPKERYELLARDLAGVGRRLVISGMHVHVGIEDPELRIDIMNQVRYFLPHLLMLSTSSPFWQGEDTGLKSYRLAASQESPRKGLPGRFNGWDEYQRTVDILVSAGLMEDSSKIWWDLRPSARFPTLEMRITDVVPRIDDAITIAAIYVCLCRMLYRMRRANLSWRTYPVFLLEENRWRAQRYGIDGSLFDFGKGALVPYKELLDEILELIREDSHALGCVEEVSRARQIAANGTSADRQLAVYKAAIDKGLDKTTALNQVVDSLVAETVADV